MSDYTIYNTSTGVIIANLQADSDSLADLNTPTGHQWIKQKSDSETQRVVDGSIVSKTSTDLAAATLLTDTYNAESKRLELLAKSDYVQTVDFNAKLSDSARTNWQNYRQALRDVPDQSGYPSSITWPTKPT
jgi:hypothetical protein